MRFTWANFLVFLAFPIVVVPPVGGMRRNQLISAGGARLQRKEKYAKRFVRTGRTLIRPFWMVSETGRVTHFYPGSIPGASLYAKVLEDTYKSLVIAVQAILSQEQQMPSRSV